MVIENEDEERALVNIFVSFIWFIFENATIWSIYTQT